MLQIPNSIKTAFFTVLFIFLFLYMFSRLFGPIPFSINSVTTTKTDLFTVSGEGEAVAVPDTATVNLGVTKTASTVEAARNEATKTANDIIAGIKELGVDENKVKTTNYSVNPNYDFTSGRETITGYTVSQNLQVEIDPIDTANKVVDMATTRGANQAGGIQFVLNDAKREQLEKQARDEAILKAKEKAQSIANSAGIRLGKIINLHEDSMGAQPPIMYDKVALGRGGDVAENAVDLQPGENTVRVTVTLFYETL